MAEASASRGEEVLWRLVALMALQREERSADIRYAAAQLVRYT